MSRALVVAVVALGCASSPPSSSASHALSHEPRDVDETTPTVAKVPRESSGASAPSLRSLAPTSLEFAFSRVQATAVSSLAVGKPPKIALLAAGEVLVFDGSDFRRLPASETREKELLVEIFFGRDDQPRLMGYRRSSDGAARPLAPFYRRYKAGRFQPEPSELGPLAGSDGALYGILGHADPEVVCRPSVFCLVKRTTGWGRVPSHAEPARVVLAGGTAWALHRDRIERLERDAWVPLAPEHAWDTPISLFVDAEGSPWVLEAKRDVVTRLAKGHWQTMASPVASPRAMWGRALNDVWLVGRGGAAHFDGAAWLGAPGVTGPLELIAYSSPDLWLAGEAGVYRGTPARSD